MAFFLVGAMIANAMDFDWSSLLPYLFTGKRTGEILNLGGRTQMWEELWYHFMRSPIIGHGFAVIAKGGGQLFSSKPHNSLLSVLIGTGMIGMSVIIMYGFRLIRELLVTSTRRCQGAVGSIGALATGLVNSLATPFIFSQWEEASVVFALFTGFFILFVLTPYRNTQVARSKPRIQASLLKKKEQ